MHRKRWLCLLSVVLAMTFLLLLQSGMSQAAPAAQSDQADGEDYIVQRGDSLYRISGQLYGNPALWPAIVEATNAKAAEDSSYSMITNPSRLRVGQKLWIPAMPDARPPVRVSEPAASTPVATPTLTRQPAVEIAPSVRFVEPADGAAVPPEVSVVLTATGVTIEPAGVIREGAGHLHVLVDMDFVPAGDVVINDEQHIHLGQGQLTTTLELEPGEHTLRLQFTNGAHIALEGEEYRDTITVTVAGDAGGPSVRFVEPEDGAAVPPEVSVVLTATGVTIEPAGVIREGAGHLHVLVDTDFVPAGDVVINDEQHIHLGQGQLTTTLELEPGEHTLRLQFTNGAHIALEGEEYRDTITVTVAGDAGGPSVRFVEPADGAAVPPEVSVVLTATGVTIEPAGVIREGAGHLHVLVDTDFVPAGDVVINDEQHIHLGQGQLTTTLELEPGEHTLRLQFTNGAHIALEGEEYQDTITVTVRP